MSKIRLSVKETYHIGTLDTGCFNPCQQLGRKSPVQTLLHWAARSSMCPSQGLEVYGTESLLVSRV